MKGWSLKYNGGYLGAILTFRHFFVFKYFTMSIIILLNHKKNEAIFHLFFY